MPKYISKKCFDALQSTKYSVSQRLVMPHAHVQDRLLRKMTSEPQISIRQCWYAILMLLIDDFNITTFILSTNVFILKDNDNSKNVSKTYSLKGFYTLQSPNHNFMQQNVQKILHKLKTLRIAFTQRSPKNAFTHSWSTEYSVSQRLVKLYAHVQNRLLRKMTTKPQISIQQCCDFILMLRVDDLNLITRIIVTSNSHKRYLYLFVKCVCYKITIFQLSSGRAV